MASNKDTTLKLIRQYEALVERGLAQGDLSKTPSFATWVEKKHGRSAMRLAQTVIHEFPQEFSTPKIAEARDTLLKTLIAEANQGEKFVELNTLLDKVNVVEGGRVRGGLFDKNSPLLHTKEDKVRMAFDNIVEADEIIEWPKKSTKNLKYAKTPLMAMIGERTGVSGPQYMDAVLAKGKLRDSNFSKFNIYKPKHIYDKELVRIAGNTGVIESGKPFSEIMADAKYRAGGGVQWSKAQGVRPDPAETINNFALRHWDHHKKHQTGNSQIEFFWNKKKNAKGKPLAVDWETVPKNKRGFKSLKGSQVFFRYKNENWGIDKLRREGRQSKLFKEVYAAKQEYNKLLAKSVPDPNNPNKKISFETLMKRTYKKGYDTLGNIYAVDHEKLVADKPFNALRVASRRLNDQLSYIAHHAKQKNFKKILTNALDLTQLDDPLRAGQELAEEVLVEGYKSPLTGPQELAQTVLKKDVDKLSRPMANQLVNLFSVSTNEELVRPILDAANLPGAKICGVVFGQGKRFGTAAGGPPGGCPDEMAQALNENPDEVFKKVAESKQKGGALGRASNWAKNILTKVPKGGRLGAILTGAGAVGAGTWAMMGGAKAEEPGTTELEAQDITIDQPESMMYNATEGNFVNAEGERETQPGMLNWIADNPTKSSLAAMPLAMGAGFGLEKLSSKFGNESVARSGLKSAGRYLTGWKALIPAMMIPHALHEYKAGYDLPEMVTNPINALWALGIRGEKDLKLVKEYYDDMKKVGRRGLDMTTLKGLKSVQGWKELPGNFKTAMMSPAAKGTNMAFGTTFRKPFVATMGALDGIAKTEGAKAWGKRALLRSALIPAGILAATPAGWLTAGFLGADFLWDQYKDYRDGNVRIDEMRARGAISEDEADNYRSLILQGSIPFGMGNRMFGPDTMKIGGQDLDPTQQRELLKGMEAQLDEWQAGDMERRAKHREDDFTFSEGGRVGMKFGGEMDRRTFLKWLGALAAGATGILKGKSKDIVKPLVKDATKAIPAKFIGVEGMPAWFPRVVAKIKAHGKLIEMADKHYVQGDIYEMVIPTKVPKFDMVGGKQKMSGFETVQKKVIMEDNPLTGEIELSWKVEDFDGEMTRQINFKPGEAGYQKFGVDDAEAAAQGMTEFHRVKVEEPEFSYGNPDQANPYREEFEYRDIFTQGDEVVDGLEALTKSKQMIAKDGTVFNIKEYDPSDKVVDEAFQKKIYKDIEGEEAVIPEPKHSGIDHQGNVYGEEEYLEIIGGDIPEHLKKKAKGGVIETGNIAREPGLVPPLSGPTPQGEGIVGLFSNPKQVNMRS